MALDNIGENIKDGADGVDKLTSSAKNNTGGWGIVAIVAAAIISIAAIWRSSTLVPDAVAKQRDKDDSYYLPVVKALTVQRDSLLRANVDLSISVQIFKEEMKMINKKVDSLKND